MAVLVEQSDGTGLPSPELPCRAGRLPRRGTELAVQRRSAGEAVGVANVLDDEALVLQVTELLVQRGLDFLQLGGAVPVKDDATVHRDGAGDGRGRKERDAAPP